MALPPPWRQPNEFEITIGEPLSPRRLAEIWRGLPERDRLPFVLALDESIADEVIELTYEDAQQRRGGT